MPNFTVTNAPQLAENERYFLGETDIPVGSSIVTRLQALVASTPTPGSSGEKLKDIITRVNNTSSPIKVRLDLKVFL